MRENKGFFISLEGPEGAGKSTQVHLLAEWLEKEGFEVLITKEPGEGKIGGAIRQIILNPENTELFPMTEAMLYAADRAQHVEEYLLPALREGKIVVCDRYMDSYLAYQGYGRGLSLAVLAQLNELAAGNLQPDMTVLLAVKPEEGFARIAKTALPTDRMEQQALEFHSRVYEGFLSIAAAAPQRVVLFAAGEPPEQVAAAIREEVIRRLQQKGLMK